jgi:lipid II:glycine glycyltransferase (peptidoglycan interpeptide bridge formation enzyme)
MLSVELLYRELLTQMDKLEQARRQAEADASAQSMHLRDDVTDAQAALAQAQTQIDALRAEITAANLQGASKVCIAFSYSQLYETCCCG